MIQEVKELGTELEAPRFTPGKVVQHTKIPVGSRRPGKGVAACVADVYRAWGSLHKPIDVECPSGITHGRWQREGTWVEVGPSGKLVKHPEIEDAQGLP